MEQLQTLRRKIDSAEDLLSVVKTMKTLAAVNIREYERAVESLRTYSRTVDLGLHVLMRDRKGEALKPRLEGEGHLGAVVFGSEQGMVGQFNDQIASFAVEKMEGLAIARDKRHLMAIGDRIGGRLEALGHRVEGQVSLFEFMMDLTSVVRTILIKIDEWRVERDIERIRIFYNRPAAKVAYGPAQVDLLPLDLDWLFGLAAKPWPTRVLPAYSMDRERLFSALLRQRFFVMLYRATVESLAAENASRLAAMQVAEKNIEERLEELNAEHQQRRQEAITAELLDIVSGFEVLSE